MRKLTSSQEVTSLLDKDLKDFKQKINSVGKLKGPEKASLLNKIDRKNINSINNLLISLETIILTKEDENDSQGLQELKMQYANYEAKFETLKKELEFVRHENRLEEEIYKFRHEGTLDSKQQYAKEIESAQKQSEDRVKNMLRMLHETKEIGNTVNAELERQLEQLDSINDHLQATESTMNRALRHINYFARTVYTDKLLIVLIVLIVLAVVGIIILSAMGKVGNTGSDTIV
jgi:t-SNARE complex subunit (syntaxin)